MTLIHDYYIIESLKKKDIKDGRIFRDSLKSIDGFNPIYIEVNDFKELKRALTEFANSNYKYLFISSHGDHENLHLNKEIVNSYDLFDIEIDLDEKRIFMSTCKGGSILFARYFIKMGAYSVVGTPDDLDQIVAVSMWPLTLILFRRFSNGNIKFSEIDKALKKIVNLYEINMHFYSFLIKSKNKMKEYIYTHEKPRERNDYEI